MTHLSPHVSSNSQQASWQPIMDVVASLSENHLRAILVALCHDPSTRNKIVEMGNKLAEAPSNCGGSDQAICVQRNNAFSVITPATTQCRFHPGAMHADPDHEQWADTDDWMDIEQDEYKAEWPEAFIWDCCDQPGTAGGCQVGPHRSQSS